MISGCRRWLLLAAAASCCAGVASPTQKVIARIDLSRPFHLPPGASFIATQGPEVDDPVYEGEKAPGLIHLCLRFALSAPCAPDLDDALKQNWPADSFSSIRYLEIGRVEFPNGAAKAPLIHLQVSSFHSGDNDQRRVAEIFVRRGGRFEVAYRENIGNNHNEEVRYIRSGPLKGSIIAALSPYGPPFSYVLKVSRLTTDYRYKQVLRYRSATIYGDGNPLAVIDSEMPNILRQLGLWHTGQPLPLPSSPCPHPHLVKTELWCA